MFGVFRFFTGAGFGGLWLAFIGWFLADAAAATHAGAEISAALADVRVRDVMSQNCPAVDANGNVRVFAEDYLLRTGRQCFIVVQLGRQLGLVTINELKGIDRSQWSFTTLGEIARPFSQIRTVSQETPLPQALQVIARENLNQLPVIANGELKGIINRSDLFQFLQTRAELKAA